MFLQSFPDSPKFIRLSKRKNQSKKSQHGTDLQVVYASRVRVEL